MKKWIHTILGCCFFTLIATCTLNKVTGTGHSGEAMVIGTITNSAGVGIENLKVELLVYNYNPVTESISAQQTKLTALTDNKGTYTIDKVPKGEYTLLANPLVSKNKRQSITRKYVYHSNITISDDKLGKNIDIGTDTLKLVGGIIVSVPDSLESKNGYIYIPGTYFYSSIDTSKRVQMQAPVGIIDIAFFNKINKMTDSLYTNINIGEGSIKEFTNAGYITIPFTPIGDSLVVKYRDRIYRTGGSYFVVDSTQDTLPVEYRFDWGDGGISPWSISDTAIHSWARNGKYQVRAQGRCCDVSLSDTVISHWSDTLYVTVVDTITTNDTLQKPLPPFGPARVKVHSNSQFSYVSDSITIFDSLEYRFDWGDGGISSWSTLPNKSYSWKQPGLFAIRIQVRLRNNHFVFSKWSESFNVRVSDDGIQDTSAITSPRIVTADTVIGTNVTGIYRTGFSISQQNDLLEYRFDWGDSTLSPWVPLIPDSSVDTVNDSTIRIDHAWAKKGLYAIYSQARSTNNSSLVSAWSMPQYIRVAGEIITPQLYSSDSVVRVNQSTSYFAGGALSSDSSRVEYFFQWGDSTNSGWVTKDSSMVINDTTLISGSYAFKTWTTTGYFDIRVIARSVTDSTLWSLWSFPYRVHVYDSIADTAQTPKPTKPYSDFDSIVINSKVEIWGGGLNNWPVVNFQYRFDWGNGTFSSWSKDSVRTNAWKKQGIYFIRTQGRRINDTTNISLWSNPYIFKVYNDSVVSDSITTPSIPLGETKVQQDTAYYYQTGGSIFITNDSLSRTIEYRFSWGDGSLSPWSTDSSVFHIWQPEKVRNNPDSLFVRAQARSKYKSSVLSQWSEPLFITIQDSSKYSVWWFGSDD